MVTNIQVVNDKKPPSANGDLSVLSNHYSKLTPLALTSQVSKAQILPEPVPNKPDKYDDIVSRKNPQQQSNPTQKDGFVQKIKNFIAAAKKLGIIISEYAKGIVLGVIKGGIVGLLTAGSFRAINWAKPYILESRIWQDKLVKMKLISLLKFPLKPVLNHPKIQTAVAVLAGLSVLAVELFKTSLNVSEITAEVDHRWNVGHRKEPKKS